MFLKIITKIMLIAPLWHFDRKTHASAFSKFLALWFLSILPLIFAGLNTTIPSDSTAVKEFFHSFVSEFTARSLFVYSISFLVPMIYLIHERREKTSAYAFSRKSAPPALKLPDGFGPVLFVAIVVFVFTAFAYRATANPGTVLDKLLTSGLVWGVYIFAMYCWYLTILLDTLFASPYDFVSSSRNEEQELASKFNSRVMKDQNDE